MWLPIILAQLAKLGCGLWEAVAQLGSGAAQLAALWEEVDIFGNQPK